jgi:hypothetical protein
MAGVAATIASAYALAMRILEKIPPLAQQRKVAVLTDRNPFEFGPQSLRPHITGPVRLHVVE